MLVTMRYQISGSRDGEDWPAPGETIDLPDDEAAELVATGMAVAGKEAAAETATDGPAETAEAPAKGRRR